MTHAEVDPVLGHVRVVELGGDVSGAFAASLLAMYGAEVMKVEPPDGDATRRFGLVAEGADSGPLFAYLNGGKQSVVLDLDDRNGRDAACQLIRSCDVVIDTNAPGALASRGIDLGALVNERPSLVVCCVTPFGQTGPRSGWRATRLTAYAAGGQMMLTGEPDLPPLKTAGYQASYQAGLHAFGAITTALYAADQTGVGDLIDISIQEVQVAALEGAGPAARVHGVDSTRSGNLANATIAIYPCSDGYIGLTVQQRQVPPLFQCIGRPELASDPRFATPSARRQNNDTLIAIIAAWTTARSASEIHELGRQHGVPFSPILSPSELLHWPGLHDVGFWRTVSHPTLGTYPLPAGPIIIAESRGEQRRPPLLGEHTQQVLRSATARRPARPTSHRHSVGIRPTLDEILVLDLTQIWAGPYATRLLADIGAQVIKIEGPRFPDLVRGLSGINAQTRSYNRAPYFNEYNRNKRGLALDLNRPEGVQVFLRLVEKVDVVIDNWRAGVAEKLGLSYERLRSVNPRIIVASMPGFGTLGRDAALLGYGPTMEQMGGLVDLQGYEGGPPHKSGISYGDPIAGITAAGAVGLALVRRAKMGIGCRVIVPQRDAIISLIGEYFIAEASGQPLPKRTGNHDSHHVPHNVYRTRDWPRMIGDALGNPIREIGDTWLAIAVDDDAAWQALCTVIDDPRLRTPTYGSVEGRRAAEAEIDTVIAAWARTEDALTAASRLQAAGVAAAPVLSPLMLVDDEHLATRSFYREYDHKEAGRHPCAGSIWRSSRRPYNDPTPAPCFGEHNEAILTELGGYTRGEVLHLAQQGIIADEPRTD
jgi:crotonobetainyl-CoA:carnitine CoA-transferase CaiB-like acyl-CoA transferase